MANNDGTYPEDVGSIEPIPFIEQTPILDMLPTEDVDYSDEESFREKLDTLKENYFPKQSVAEAETVDDVETGTAQDVDLTPSMDAYTAAIGRTLNG